MEHQPVSRLPAPDPALPGAPFTFAVLGDNRGDSYGEQPAVFGDILQAVNEAAPQLILHVGDMINGYAGDDESFLRNLWEAYRQAIHGLKAPVYHVPGNHDVFDALSARLWQELWGPTYYAFDHNGIRFIALDTETEANQLGEVQFAWVARQLAEAAGGLVFVFLHRPLFPVNGHRGISLDSHPVQRDRLHDLFVRHRSVIQGVFQGHEHLYHFERRDGVPYYILGGGGEELYVPPELGGFHHFLLVHVAKGRAAVEVKKAGETAVPPRPVLAVTPGALLETWESTLFWYTWDHSVRKELTHEHATNGQQGLKVWFDLSRYEWPALIAPLSPPRDLSAVGALAVDLHVPDGLAGLGVTLVLEAKSSFEPPPVPLHPGWNSVVVELHDRWLPREERNAVKEMQWVLTAAGDKLAGWVVFDNFRAEQAGRVAGAESSTPRPGLPKTPAPATRPPVAAVGPGSVPDLRDGWEGMMLWGVWDHTVKQEPVTGPGSPPRRGLRIRFDLARCDAPVLYASLNPLWDLSRVGALATDVHVPGDIPGSLSIHVSLAARDVKYRAPPVALVSGWNEVRTDLSGAWLAQDARANLEQLEWRLAASAPRIAGWVIFGPLRAEH
jgi:hypothetical protein